jgi:hypothetical protein
MGFWPRQVGQPVVSDASEFIVSQENNQPLRLLSSALGEGQVDFFSHCPESRRTLSLAARSCPWLAVAPDRRSIGRFCRMDGAAQGDSCAVRDIRVTMPAAGGLLKAVKLAAELRLPVRVLAGQPTADTLAELSETPGPLPSWTDGRGAGGVFQHFACCNVWL